MNDKARGVYKGVHVHPPVTTTVIKPDVKPQVREETSCPRDAREAVGGVHVHPCTPPLGVRRECAHGWVEADPRGDLACCDCGHRMYAGRTR